MKRIRLSQCEVAYDMVGEGKDIVVIQTALSSCSAEWWHVAEDLGKQFRILVFDRAGYGESTLSVQPRTPENVSAEMKELLEKLGIESPVILLGHSQGGLYSVDFALRYSNKVKSLLLLDPLTPFDDEFHTVLSEEEYRNSGINKLAALKMGKALSGLGLGFLIKPLLKKSPPFYYYNFPSEASSYLLRSLVSKKSYITAIDEYCESEKSDNVVLIRRGISNHALGDIPVTVITHSSKVYLDEMAKYSSIGENASARMEALWQEIMKRYLNLSKKSVHLEASNSSHFIHLTDYVLLKQALISMLN